MAGRVPTLSTLAAATVAAAALMVLPAQSGAGLVRADAAFATANMVVTDETGCIQSSLGLSALDQRNRPLQDGVASALQLFVNLTKYDVCSDTVLFNSAAGRDLPDDELAIASSSRTARLHTTLDLVDDSGSGSTLQLALDLIWTADEQPSLRTSEKSRSTGGGFHLVIWKNRFEQRLAALSGSASDGTVEYTAGDLLFVQTGDTREATLIVPESVSALLAARTKAASGKPSSSTVDSRFMVSVWESFDQGGCIRNLGIVAVDGRTDETGPLTTAFVDFSSFDHCLNMPLFWVTTELPIASEPDGFSLSRDLAVADLDATLPGIDRVSGAPVTLTVDLHLDGVGEIAASDSKYKQDDRGVKTDFRFSSRSRGATITGSVSDGTQDLLAGFPVGPQDLVFSGFGDAQTSIKVH